jgi:type II secretory ATPase GspE/PulE/Tfp pilus assembly ATPase PilB-like protein
VGEIRDAETAHIAARAALTGTQVLSTLHANDTAATVDLFREFELPPMFIADSLNCVIAQRLLRKVCTKDRETYHPDAATAQILGLNPDQCGGVDLVRGIPSPSNFNTGYAGRTGVFEIMRVDNDTRNAILQKRSNVEIRELSRSKGMQTLEQSAINKVLAGVTTVEEMHRVLLAG